MVRTKIYLTTRAYEGIRRIARRTAMTQSEVIRGAVDHWLAHSGRKGREQVLESVAGIWRNRTDLPDLSALRRGADRVRPARRRAINPASTRTTLKTSPSAPVGRGCRSGV